MKKLLIHLLLLIITFSSVNVTMASCKDKRTPFTKVKYIGTKPYAYIDNTFVELISIGGIDVNIFIRKAIDENPSNWKLGFHRYLHYMMDDMKIKRGKTINVTYRKNGIILSKDMELKKNNRNLATKYHDSIIGKNRIKSPIPEFISKGYKYLTKRLDGYELKKDFLSRDKVIADLEYLEWEIKNHYSYAKLRGFNFHDALSAIKADVKNGISKRDLALQLKMFMANFGDGHSRVSLRYVFKEENEFLRFPFIIVKHGNKYYAINSNTKTNYLNKYPYISKINNVDIKDLYKTAKSFIPKTTSKFVDRNTVDYMNIHALMLKIMNFDINKDFKITFSNSKNSITKNIKLGKYRHKYLIDRPNYESKTLDGDIGYITFNHMFSNKKYIKKLHQSMQDFKNTKGIIIDIRGNGGGSRAPLRALLPYFLKKPVVTNIARYRINENEEVKPINGYLLARFAYPSKSKLFTRKERRIIKRFKKHFSPKYTINDNLFTQYHYMVVSPKRKGNFYHYKNKVVVLTDSGCFSASDIFAAGMKTAPNVTLLGETTGGGSGYSKGVRLPNSRIKVKLSRIVSYQPDGNLYDGHGVIPDIKEEYTLKDKLGLTDTQLDKAKDIILK
ncbi:MAG: S41 family peptidase [Marinifilaceae bacterium]|nr:S41 family peptidase [Marinifilaceae bacterium]